MTVAYVLACPQLESAVFSKRMKHNQSQHRMLAANPRLKGSIAESPRSRRFSSAEVDESSSKDEFASVMQVKYDGHTVSTPRVGLLVQTIRSTNHAIV